MIDSCRHIPSYSASRSYQTNSIRTFNFAVLTLSAFILGLLVTLVGCSQQAMLENFAPAADQAFAKSQIQALRMGEFDKIRASAAPSIQGPTLLETLAKMAAEIPAGEPLSIKLVGAQIHSWNDATLTNLTYEYEYPGKWLIINVATQKNAVGIQVVGFRVVPNAQSLAELNQFTLWGKSVIQYVVLLLAIVVPLFSLYALVLCVRTPFKGRKWHWVLFIILGVGQLAVNWTTGEWQLRVFSLQLFGASAFAPPHGPWIFSASLPLGALLFLRRRSKLRRPESGSNEATMPIEPGVAAEA